MNTEPIKEVLNELFSHLERLETQSDAILQFLKEKKRVTDKQLEPYLEQAGNASNVRWRAARVRIEHLLSSVEDKEEEIKLGKKPEIAQAESEKKQTGEQKKADSQKKEQPTHEQIASPEMEAPMQAKPEQKKKGDAEQPSDRQPVAADSEKREEANHPTEMTQDAVQRDSGKPVDEMKPKDKSKDHEAA
jgi:hypothetical protein